MRTEIVAFDPAHLEAVRRFAEQTWQRPRTAAFYRWRYVDAPGQRTFVALRDGECLAMGCGMRRPYRVGNEIVDVLETYDWYAKPGLRSVGLGVRIIQRFMAEPEPLLLVGGSDDAVDLLRRLRWMHAGTALRFARRLSAGLADALARRFRLPGGAARLLAGTARPLQRLGRHRAPSRARSLAVASVGAEVDALYCGSVAYGTLPLWTHERLAWITTGFPGTGHFLPLYFVRDEELLGWALLRIRPTATGCHAELTEIMNPAADVDLYTWMVAEVVRHAEGFAADSIGASTACPSLQQALRRNGLKPVGPIPIHAWWAGRSKLPEPLLLGANTRDTAINPYPTRWWGDPSGASTGLARSAAAADVS